MCIRLPRYAFFPLRHCRSQAGLSESSGFSLKGFQFPDKLSRRTLDDSIREYPGQAQLAAVEHDVRQMLRRSQPSDSAATARFGVSSLIGYSELHHNQKAIFRALSTKKHRPAVLDMIDLGRLTDDELKKPVPAARVKEKMTRVVEHIFSTDDNITKLVGQVRRSNMGSRFEIVSYCDRSMIGNEPLPSSMTMVRAVAAYLVLCRVRCSCNVVHRCS